jgi:hypothetical protein
MHFSNFTKIFWSIALSVSLTHIPQIAVAESISPTQMIPTGAVIEGMNRQQAQEKIRDFLSREDVQKQLMKNGVTSQEAELRLAALSEQELKRLAVQMDEARAGGDLGGILILVLLVLLIVFLAKRI